MPAQKPGLAGFFHEFEAIPEGIENVHTPETVERNVRLYGDAGALAGG